tara:strand:- start:3330 stop:4109 length:780 start_codon:yes stop_codon:yes gene_type:complete
MTNVLPSDTPGLDIQNVIYSYRIQKETGEWVTVYVQNENANGEGYVFRERDDWAPGSLAGTQINKAVPVGDLPRELWGPGSIEVVGNGSVSDASVVYTYKVSPCYDPQFDPNCPGYKQPVPTIIEVDLADLYDVTTDENVELNAKQETQEMLDQAEADRLQEEEEAEEEKRRKYRLEKAMSIRDTDELFAESTRISQMNTLAQARLTNQYLGLSIPGGQYNEQTVLVDTQLPDAKSGLRNGLAQQLLHQQMIEMQYILN